MAIHSMVNVSYNITAERPPLRRRALTLGSTGIFLLLIVAILFIPFQVSFASTLKLLEVEKPLALYETPIAIDSVGSISETTPPSPLVRVDGDTSVLSNGGNWCGTWAVYGERIRKERLATSLPACRTYGPCDDPEIRDMWIPDSTVPITYIHMITHVFRDDNGENPSLDDSLVDRAIDYLNLQFLPARIQFVHTMNYIDSQKWLDQTYTVYVVNQMKRATAVRPDSALNLWIHPFDWPGYASQPYQGLNKKPEGGIILMNAITYRPTGSALPHEMGHVFGLRHTFHGYLHVEPCDECYESPGAANADYVGDFCSDTPPNPLYCDCDGQPEGVDPCSGEPWVYVLPDNHMGCAPYSCLGSFTPQQMARMRCWLNDKLLHWEYTVGYSPSCTFGPAPLDVSFSSTTFKDVDRWIWDFGDGHGSDEAHPSHAFGPGEHIVSVAIETPDGTYSAPVRSKISVHADTVSVVDVAGRHGQELKVDIVVRNYVHLRSMTIPVSYSGPLYLAYDSVSVQGTRCELFDKVQIERFDKLAQLITVSISGHDSTVLGPGYGPVLSIHFKIPTFVDEGSNRIEILDSESGNLGFVAVEGEYLPEPLGGTVRLGCCRRSTGNVDGDPLDLVDVSDLTSLIDYLFISFIEPECLAEANVDGDPEGQVDLGDLTALIDYLFISFTPPAPCF